MVLNLYVFLNVKFIFLLQVFTVVNGLRSRASSYEAQVLTAV